MLKAAIVVVSTFMTAVALLPVNPDDTGSGADSRLVTDGGADAAGGSLKQKIFVPKPIDIRSDGLKVFHRDRYGVFSGNVRADRGDVQLFCDELKAFYDEAGAVKRLECRGRVLAVMGTKQARGGLAVYEADQDTVRITDNPVLSDGDDTMRGEVVIFNLGDDTVRIEKPRGRYQTSPVTKHGGGDGGHD